MAHDIIMPALGMAQDTGLLVAWRKAPGDFVAVGEPLFEVETDKATMEVEASAAGYLSAVTAGDGEDVPVGQVIARLVESEAEVDRIPPKSKAATATAAVISTPVATVPVPSPTPTPSPAKPVDAKPAEKPQATNPGPVKPSIPKPQTAPQQVQGRILASPKARQMANEQGLDLSRLVRAGHPQPYHVADLDHLRALGASARSSLIARVDGSALQALMKKATGADSARLLAAFAKGAWAQVSDEALSVTLMRADGIREGEGALLLVDLTRTRLATYVPNEGLVLSVGQEGAMVTLSLTFDESTLSFATAAAWLNETAARVEDPVRQLI
jgi:pyruvate/2-oxoglutarate dehydrogenase complex dihydrolipoamide acyltransferase (E2) component